MRKVTGIICIWDIFLCSLKLIPLKQVEGGNHSEQVMIAEGTYQKQFPLSKGLNKYQKINNRKWLFIIACSI
jgi:hypothetical protein